MNRTLLDLRGLVLHALHSGRDPDADRVAGHDINTPGHCLENFITRYWLPFTGLHRINDIIAVRDAGNNYRRRLYPAYKQHRREISDEVKQATRAAEQAVTGFLERMGVIQVWVDGTEADDVLAYLVKRLPGRLTIHTRDADLIQLASDRVLVIQMEEIRYDYEDKAGNRIAPHHLALYKSLVGDTSDGYKGIGGFGPARWRQLQELYGLDGLDELHDAVRQMDFMPLRDALDADPNQPLLRNLLDHRDEWLTSWQLASLHPELCEGFRDGAYTRIQWSKRLPNAEEVRQWLDRYGCLHLHHSIESALPYRVLVDADNFETTLADARELFATSPYIAFDLETSDTLQHPPFRTAANGDYVDMLASRITGAGFTCGENAETTFYVAFDHAGTRNVPVERLLDLLHAIPNQTPVIVHNALFELTVIDNQLGYRIPLFYDTKIMAHHVDENESCGLKDLSKRYLEYNQTHYGDVIGMGKSMRDYSAAHVFSYGADDPFVTAHLYDLFRLVLDIEGTWEFVVDNEFPALHVLSQGFIEGVSLDMEAMNRQAEDDRVAQETAIQALHQSLADNLNPTQIADGANNLYAELCQALLAQAEREQWSDERRAIERDKLMVQAYEMASYTPPTTEPKLPTVAFTAASFSKVAAVLGCPPVEKITVGYRCGYQAPVAWFEAGVQAGSDPEFLLRCQQTLFDANPEFIHLGDELCLNSPKQMLSLLYGKLALPVRLRSFNVSESRKVLGLDGSPSTDKDAIADAQANILTLEDWRYHALEHLKTAKTCQTRNSLFYSKLPLWIHPQTGNVHPGVNSVGTDTRRPTGSNPNFFQLSKAGEGVKVRRCVLPNRNKGHDLVISLDFDQEELRLAAGLSGDRAMISCYIGENLRDMHSITGASMAKMSYEEFSAIRNDAANPQSKKLTDIRKLAKNVNFLSLYRGGAAKLSRKLLKSEAEAQAFLDAKAEAFPRYEAWTDEVIAEAKSQGWVSTLYGSRRHLYSRLRSGDRKLDSSYERKAINYKVQSLAADILKRVLADLWRSQLLQKHAATFYIPLYDEMVFSCHHTQAVALIQGIHALMVQDVPGLPVPIRSSISLGANFGDQIELGTEPDTAIIVEAVGRALGDGRRYWYHPESDSLFTTDGTEAANDGLVEELDWTNYANKLARGAK
jgi:DNA polymerase I-like protein with 3'-5' exonuclease and polymerase domains/5'-3' exonuclease